MTNKTEDRFYFGKHGQPERFAREVIARKGNKRVELSGPMADGDWAVTVMEEGKQVVPGEVNERFVQSKFYSTEAGARRAASKMLASRLGQPDEFDLSEACWDGYEPVGTKRKDGRTVPNCVQMKNEKPERFAKIDGSVTSVALANPYLSNIPLILKDGRRVTATQKDGRWSIAEMPEVPARRARNIYTFVELLNREGFSRPGKPERFDASSLDRKGFAAASSSPMLGKLLSEKQMPEGGWRAVETGGNALVISFEDGDVAGNFARRVAGSGYSATAPVQSIGRYWNVEVKNGKV
jgi:hypothetical protein